ncbi:uncharacterized protein LOC112462106 isoform X1 [Temnothorax curvispinosus]|uniref:Uncharacterized protein LOC112462106 isoform X1 n=1 Tax=Temnothorax curvispinosus TaxID=300111 RepID=A0A6J1QS94_9HYME|nr:uncharacterized protein LOC112462106 isoform X1 [Temnothorax curvispinosus]
MMDKRLKAIEEHYTNLEYENNTVKALPKISTLTKELKFMDINNFSERFLKTASVIEENLSLFKAACEHTDTITTIIKYLNYFGMKFKLGSMCDEEYKKGDVVLLVILTVLRICGEIEMLSFLEHAIIKNSALEKSIRYERLIHKIRSHTNEIILLGDADLYAVIGYLRNRKSIFDLIPSVNKVWVQEPIKEKFLWLVKEYVEYSFPIYTFRTKNELFTARTPNEINIVSIWTEDIVFAKNLAMSLNRDVLFINTYMDFYNGTVLLPYIKMFDETLYKRCEPNFDDSIKQLSVQRGVPVYNLFYDGIWQPPVKGTYYTVKNIHGVSQWANATSGDVNKCINSAEKGFKIWSSKSVACRMQILSKFASTLKCSEKFVLGDITSQWIKFSFIYENSLSWVSQSEGSEVTKIRNPRGVIILKEDDEIFLFQRLMQILTVGNSVIVICDSNFCSLVPYCNMFSVSEIPPGVINLLSSENVKDLELSLCGMDYESYAKQFFSEDPDDLEKTYINLTTPKQIIVPLK